VSVADHSCVDQQIDDDDDDDDGAVMIERLLMRYCCYDVMPSSCKVIVLDSQLEVRRTAHHYISLCLSLSLSLYPSLSVCLSVGLCVTLRERITIPYRCCAVR